MLVLAGFLILVLSVPLAGGQLGRLAQLRFRHSAALVAAIAIQVTIAVLADHADPLVLGVAHVLSYVSAGVFLVANRRIAGLWLVGLGGLLNAAAISANGGVMPASGEALEAAGWEIGRTQFSNSMAVENARLAFLGDVFAIPQPWPFANVFSIGDVCLVLGGIVVLHRVCGSKLVPSGTRQFTSLRAYPDFVRLWGAQTVSNLGDWTYSLAVAASVADRGDAAHVLATLLITQVGPAAAFSLFGGPLIDRAHRKRLMIISDVFRAAAVGSLFLSGGPSLPHLYAVAGVLGLWGAVFQPTLQASLPNLVPKHRLVAANALVSGTYNMAIMVGPVLGGVLVASLGATAAFGVNAFSFVVSAVLVTTVRLPRRIPAESQSPQLQALVAGARYAARTPLVRGVMVTIFLVVFAAAIRGPLEPLFILQTLSQDASALGLVGGAWGFGMLLGSIAAPAASRRWPREWMFAVSIAAVGLAVLAASRATMLSPVLAFWLLAGGGNAVGTIAYESLLQERTPDDLRGRVLAATEAAVQLAFLSGALVAGWLGTVVGLRGSFVVSGVLFLLAAVVCRILLGSGREGAKIPAEDDDRVGFGLLLKAPPAVTDSTIAAPSLLLVEPDLVDAKAMSATLGEAGFSVDRAATGDDVVFALDHIAAPALVVLALQLPDVEAAALLERIGAQPGWQAVPVLATAMAGTSDSVLQHEGLRGRVADFVEKPCSREELQARVRRLVPDVGAVGNEPDAVHAVLG